MFAVLGGYIWQQDFTALFFAGLISRALGPPPESFGEEVSLLIN